MCGIAGIINFKADNYVQETELKAMANAIVYRGPDDDGYYLSNNVGFGFRRLSIIDLQSGHQPISNENNSVWVVMNGEIYNYKSLKNELIAKGHHFKSESDTEVLVHLYEEHGDEFVKKLRGMFAFALHDTKKNRVLLARDRVGIKPLFYYHDTDGLVFGSELKEIKKLKPQLQFNNQGIADYFSYGYTLKEKTCYQNVFKLRPAHYLSIELSSGKVNTTAYWQVKYQPNNARNESEWIELLNEKLSESVKSHMIADVPLGAFLSGGVDSSAVVAKMAAQSNLPVKTFSIGFKEEQYNELQYAKLVSQKFKTEHHELILEPSSIDIINNIVDLYDEPFADSSAIPTYFLSKMTAEHVKVVLSGDGGDEIFAGYKSYQKANYVHSRLKAVSPLLKHVFNLGFSLYPNQLPGKGLLYYLSKDTAELACYNGIFKEYELKKLWQAKFSADLQPYSAYKQKINMLKQIASGDYVTDCELLDVHAYMVDDILTKVDRASMANSLEVRVPLLDHELIELAFTIPSQFKLKNNEGKYILKKALEPELPHEILYRKKQGFALPLSKWFNNDLSQFVNDVLLDKNNRMYNYLNYAAVEQVIKASAAGKRDFSAQIWTLLFFSQWLKKNA